MRPSFPYSEVFACPWYSKFDEALSANPAFDLDCLATGDFPYDGVVDWENIPVERNCTDGYDNDGDGHVDSEDPDCLS